MHPVLFSSKNQSWCTPQDLFDELNAEFGFVLDAAATEQTKKCELCYTPETDGLANTWNFGGAVFCNPPYGRDIGKWVKKAHDEALKMPFPIVLLIPARTDTRYFHEYIYNKASLRFLRGRVHFTDEHGVPALGAPFPSMLVIYNRGSSQQAWWEQYGRYNQCSACKEAVCVWDDDGEVQRFAFCPNCGAEMNIEVRHEN